MEGRIPGEPEIVLCTASAELSVHFWEVCGHALAVQLQCDGITGMRSEDARTLGAQVEAS